MHCSDNLDVVVLLGWMDKTSALRFLVEDRVDNPQMTVREAEELWLDYRRRVRALPDRTVRTPQILQLDDNEQRAAEEFRRIYATSGRIRDVIKIDPTDLLVRQFCIVLSRAEDWVKAVGPSNGLNGLFEENIHDTLTIQHRLNEIQVELPHSDFGFAYDPQLRRFNICQLPRHVSLMRIGDRMVLWAGYHRAFACIKLSMIERTPRSMLCALTTDGGSVFSADRQARRLRAILQSRRPPSMADFLDEGLCFRTCIRRKQFVLRISATISALAPGE